MTKPKNIDIPESDNALNGENRKIILAAVGGTYLNSISKQLEFDFDYTQTSLDKTCLRCSQTKPLAAFNKNKNIKDGHAIWCRDCHSEYYADYYKKNKEKILAKNLIYDLAHPECVLKRDRKYKKLNPEKSKIHYRDNKDKRGKQIRIRKKERLKTDIVFKLSCIIRSNINDCLNRNGYKKKSRTTQVLGCTYKEFREHLEKQFEKWMAWDNHGKYNGTPNFGWDIDHIIPISSAKTEEDVIRLCHHLNLRPLCSYVNRAVKRNRLDF